MKVKTAELSGVALDWAVAKCENIHLTPHRGGWAYAAYSTDWAQCGPIIEREKIATYHVRKTPNDVEWIASLQSDEKEFSGPTILVAAMRCYVNNKLGDEVEIPDAIAQ